MRRFPVLRTLVVATAIAIAVGFDAHGQPRGGESSYDGRVTFVRLRWGPDFGGFRRGAAPPGTTITRAPRATLPAS